MLKNPRIKINGFNFYYWEDYNAYGYETRKDKIKILLYRNKTGQDYWWVYAFKDGVVNEKGRAKVSILNTYFKDDYVGVLNNNEHFSGGDKSLCYWLCSIADYLNSSQDLLLFN